MDIGSWRNLRVNAEVTVIGHGVGHGGVYGDETEQGWVSIQQHEVDRTSNAARRFLYPGFILEQSQRKALIRSETPLTARHCRHQVGETDGCNLPSSLVPREVCELISLVLIKL